jgi:hypothetical protein
VAARAAACDEYAEIRQASAFQNGVR